MSKPLIRDIPQFRKLLEDTKNFAVLQSVMPVLRPFLRLMGADVHTMDEALEKIGDISGQADDLARLPDRFNAQFSSWGWVIYEDMELELAKSALAKAEAGDHEGAEAELVEHYSAENVRWRLQRMLSVEAFRPRMRLAELALEDYVAGRYHACIPVVLALLDGMVSMAHERRRGFFAEDANLTAWDSISAHESGLGELTKIFQKSRYKTNTDSIELPYRNGILHGMDLAYDNKKVAAKCWAALFAARDWATRAEQGRLEVSVDEPPASWREIFRKVSETAKLKEHIKGWRARQVVIGRDAPPSGPPEMYSEGTPERKLAEYLSLWGKRNYGHMAKCLSPTLGPPPNKAPMSVREAFKPKVLHDWKFVAVNDQSAAVTIIEAHLVYEEDGKRVERLFPFRLMCLDSKGKASVRGMPGMGWVVMSWCVF